MAEKKAKKRKGESGGGGPRVRRARGARMETNGRTPRRTADEPWVQLATRIPKSLHQQLKLHSVVNDVSVMDFVVGAIGEKLGKAGGGKGAGA